MVTGLPLDELVDLQRAETRSADQQLTDRETADRESADVQGPCRNRSDSDGPEVGGADHRPLGPYRVPRPVMRS